MKKVIKTLLKLISSVICLLLCAVLIAGVIFGVQGYNMYSEAIKEESIENRVEEIQSVDNYITFDELPDIYVDAVISVEDHRFWEHGGIDVIAIFRAAVNDIKAMDYVEGGSTITQQIAKNMLFTQEKELERKFAEVFAAFEIESLYTKEEIFEIYVNTIYFGSGYYGIYDAAMGYFGKEPKNLTNAEAVMLAGLPNAPSNYSPDVNPELAVERMKQVLESMVKNNLIDQNLSDELVSQWYNENTLYV